MVRLAYSWEKSLLLLAHYFRVTLFIVFWLSFTQAAICKPRESPEGKRLYFSSPFLLHYVVINSHMSVSCVFWTAAQFSFWGASGRLLGATFQRKSRTLWRWSACVENMSVARGERTLKPLIMRLFVSGDSFVVNACLARKGLDDWLVKQKYYCASPRLEPRDCHHKNSCGLTTRVSTTPSTRLTQFLVPRAPLGLAKVLPN